MKKVVIDVDECAGCESCVEFCPEIFEMENDSGKVRIIKEVSEDEEEDAQEAIDSCPTECIDWAD